MMHDWRTFGREIAALIKTSGDTGDSGDKSKFPNNSGALAVTTHKHVLSPVDLSGDSNCSTSGDRKDQQNEPVSGGVTSVTTVTTAFQRRRDLVSEPPTGLRTAHVPEAWREGFLRLAKSEPLEGFGAEEWSNMIRDGGQFFADWGPQFEAFGWGARDVFGVDRHAPAARHGCKGLAFFIARGSVVAITAASATIQRKSGARLTWQRRQLEQVCIWELLKGASHASA